MSEHTAGPWQIGGPNKNEVSGSHAPAFLVAFCPFGVLGLDVAQANARLVAALPDLLEACQAIYSEVGAGGDLDWHLRQEGHADTLRAAIAKATGEAQDADDTA